jgi:hypothetical protein
MAVDDSDGRSTGFGPLMLLRKTADRFCSQLAAMFDISSRKRASRSSFAGDPRSNLPNDYSGCEDAGNNEGRKAVASSC